MGDGPEFTHEILVQPHDLDDGQTILVQVDVKGPGRVFVDITDFLAMFAAHALATFKQEMRKTVLEALK